MNETNSSWLTASGTSTINGYSGCTISTGTALNTNLGTVGMGVINPSSVLTVSNSKQYDTKTSTRSSIHNQKR